MRLSTCLSILVSACLLTSCGGAGGGGTTTTPTAPPVIKAKLNCNGSSGDIRVGNKPDTVVTFSTPARCAPLQSITPDPPAPGFKNRVISNGTISYTYDGRQLPSEGYSFSYMATGAEKDLANNGTGVIKN